MGPDSARPFPVAIAVTREFIQGARRNIVYTMEGKQRITIRKPSAQRRSSVILCGTREKRKVWGKSGEVPEYARRISSTFVQEDEERTQRAKAKESEQRASPGTSRPLTTANHRPLRDIPKQGFPKKQWSLDSRNAS